MRNAFASIALLLALSVGQRSSDQKTVINTITPAPKADGLSNATRPTVAVPTVRVGRTVTLDPSKNAVVTNSGTSTDLVLDFGIPQGEAGEDADKNEISKLRAELVALKAKIDSLNQPVPVPAPVPTTPLPTREEIVALIKQVANQVFDSRKDELRGKNGTDGNDALLTELQFHDFDGNVITSIKPTDKGVFSIPAMIIALQNKDGKELKRSWVAPGYTTPIQLIPVK